MWGPPSSSELLGLVPTCGLGVKVWLLTQGSDAHLKFQPSWDCSRQENGQWHYLQSMPEGRDTPGEGCVGSITTSPSYSVCT